METDLEIIGQKLAEATKAQNRQTGNSFIEATRVMKILFPNGNAGKEQEFATSQKIVERIFAIANAPLEASRAYWEEITAIGMNAIKASTV